MEPSLDESLDLLAKIVEARDFKALIGKIENAMFDCKAQPYLLTDEKNKRELAKDVSAFANAGGGYIFLGVKTKKSLTHFGDEVTEITPFPENLVNPIQYMDTIRAWTFPEINGLSVKWIPIQTASKGGVAVIYIPAQAPSAGPFLITKSLDGAKVIETVFGYAARKGDSNQPLEVKDLQRYLRSGMSFDDKFETRMAGIEAQVKIALEGRAFQERAKLLSTTLEQRVIEAIQHGELNKRSFFALTAQPTDVRSLQTVFSSQPKSINSRTQTPPKLRSMGWTVEGTEGPTIVRGEFIRMTNGRRKVLDLYLDGTMIFAVPVDKDFLTWGKKDGMINPLALIEVTSSFMSLYAEVLNDFNDPPEEICLGTRFHFTDINAASLGPGEVGSIAQMVGTEQRPPPERDWQKTFSVAVKDFNAEVATYDAIRQIYLWFGLSDDKVPYSREKKGRRAVDFEKIAGIQ
jgi:hypothetical protein